MNLALDSEAVSNSVVAAAAWYLALSAITYVVYRHDKRAAKRRSARVSESTLHLLAFLGGFPGAMVARRHLRHKSMKQSFSFVLWLTVILHLAAWCAVIWFRVGDG